MFSSSTSSSASRSAEDVLSRILSEFECPICYEYVCPPIFSCGNGHYLCNSCKAILRSQCPLCEDAFFIRNRTMDSIFKKLTLPCKFKDEGCDFVYNGDNLAAKEVHAKFCRYDTTMYCPMKKNMCTWYGKHEDMPTHFEECHSALITPDSLIIDLDSLADRSDIKKWFIRKFSNYFQVTVRKKHVFVNIAVEVIWSYDVTKFSYGVKFHKDRRSGKTVTNKCEKIIIVDTGLNTEESIGTTRERFVEVELFDESESDSRV